MKLIWTVDELVKHHFPSTYIIEPWLPRGGIALFYGKRGIGKSHFALTLAACLSNGGTLFGRYRTRKGPVVYVQADMGKAIMKERLVKSIKMSGFDQVYFHFADFMSVPTMSESDEVVQAIRACKPEVIIWDTLRQIHQMDIIDNAGPAMVYGTLKHLFPDVTHVFLHHEKKTIVDQSALAEDEVFSGSGAWIDNADAGLRLKEVAPGRLTLSFTKVRTCEAQQQLTLSLDSDAMLLYAVGEDIRGLAAMWRQEHPSGSTAQLERFLLDSFAAPPRAIRAVVRGDSRGGGGSGSGEESRTGTDP